MLVHRGDLARIGEGEAARERAARLACTTALEQCGALGIRETKLQAWHIGIGCRSGEASSRSRLIVLESKRLVQSQQRVEQGELVAGAQGIGLIERGADLAAGGARVLYEGQGSLMPGGGEQVGTF